MRIDALHRCSVSIATSCVLAFASFCLSYANAQPAAKLETSKAQPTFLLEAASLKRAKVVVDGKIWKLDADRIDDDGERVFKLWHREWGPSLYLFVSEADHSPGFNIDNVLNGWMNGGSDYTSTKIDPPVAIKIDPAWRCAARNVVFTDGIEKILVFCMQKNGLTTVDFSLGLPKKGWEGEAVAINSAIAAIQWVNVGAK